MIETDAAERNDGTELVAEARRRHEQVRAAREAEEVAASRRRLEEWEHAANSVRNRAYGMFEELARPWVFAPEWADWRGANGLVSDTPIVLNLTQGLALKGEPAGLQWYKGSAAGDSRDYFLLWVRCAHCGEHYQWGPPIRDVAALGEAVETIPPNHIDGDSPCDAPSQVERIAEALEHDPPEQISRVCDEDVEWHRNRLVHAFDCYTEVLAARAEALT
jgi:hypothetical protein